MRFVRYTTEGSTLQTGMVQGDNIFKLRGDPLNVWKPGDKVALLKDVQLLAPCRPGKIIAIAINFPGIKGYSPAMQEPMVFLKTGNSVCNPYQTVFNPFPDLPWWGEAELGVVIRSTLKNATIDQVRKAVFGFTIGNDVTVGNIDGRDHHLARSKCPDSFCPIGPWIDTDFDASDCLIEAVQNGEVIRRARSSEQVWQWPRILVWLSKWMTLDPWDVVLTGNAPDTVGMRYANDGDVYTARIEGLGELTNRFALKRRGSDE